MSDIERNRSVAQNVIMALGRRDVPAVRKLVVPDADWWVMGLGTLKRDAVLEIFSTVLCKAINSQFAILGTVAEGDRVVIEGKGSFEFADGRVYRNEYTWHFVVRNGQVHQIREYLDTAVGRAFTQTG
jgi:ketosteroid isomerase-like protein